MSNDDEYERMLIFQIERLQEDYRKAAEPYVNKLVKLRSMKPPPPITMTMDQLPEYLKDQIKKNLLAVTEEPQQSGAGNE